MRSTFRILFYLKKGNPKKNGKFAIMVRITVDGDLTQFSTKLEVLPNKWDVKSGKVKGNSAMSINLNRELDNLKVKASEHYTSLINQLQFATPERIKNLLLGFEEKEKTIISYFDRFNKQYKLKVGTTTTWTTYTKYVLTRNRLEEFIKTTKGINDLHIRELNSIFLEDFYLFLRNTHNSGKAILKKYEGKQKDGKLLPVVSNKSMNEYLHEIATICGIDKKITSHQARHSNYPCRLKTSKL